MTQTVEHVSLPAPLTLADIKPDGWWPSGSIITTRIYQNGTRLDNGWMFRWDGISRKVPDFIPMTKDGELLVSMDVLCKEDRNTIASIIARYPYGEAVEYVLETAYNPAAHCYPPKTPARAYAM